MIAGWGNYVSDIDIELVPGVGFVKLGTAEDPDNYPTNKGDYPVYLNNTISVKRCGNDCVVLFDHDAVYQKMLIEFPAYGYSDNTPLRGPFMTR